MPTSSSSSSRSSTAATSAVAKEVADLLAVSQSATIYLDAELSDADAAALLQGDPPLHAEHDAVRDQWAFRKATPEEVADAKAAAEAASTASSSSTSSASSGTAASSA